MRLDTNAGSELRPAGRDVLFRPLLESGRRRLVWWFALSLLIGVVPILLSWRNGDFRNPRLELDALHDIGYANQALLLLPFCVFFFAFYFSGLEPALKVLRNRGVVLVTEENWKDFVVEANKVFTHWAITVVPLFIGLAALSIALLSYTLAGLNTWNSPPKGSPLSLTAVLSLVPIALLYYLLPGFVVRVAAVYFVVQRFLKHPVSIQPFHPDRCGGLAPLGRFSLRITGAGIVAGVASVVGMFTVYYQYHRPFFHVSNIAILAGYVCGLSVVFFVPLLAARSGMLAAKQESLQLISDRFTTTMATVMESIGPTGTPSSVKVQELRDLTDLYRVANEMPVYPFNTANMARFFGSVLWPLGLMAIDWFLGKL